MHNKPIWSEGMFLQPQHLQQYDRYNEFLFRLGVHLFNPYAWGFDALELDRELLPLGQIGIKSCRGLFPDGTLIDIPNLALSPTPLSIPKTTVNSIVYLAIPLRQLGLPEVTDNTATTQPIRYLASPSSIQDNTSDNANDTVLVDVGFPRLSLIPTTDPAYSCVAIAMIEEVISGKGICLNENFIPPLLNINNNATLKTYINELTTLIHYRAETLARHVSGIEDAGISEIADFMLLQLMNRYSAIFDDLSQGFLIHPHTVYLIFSQLLAELTTFEKKTAPVAPPYVHDNLSETFLILLSRLRHAFLIIVSQNAQSLPIEQIKSGLWVAKIPNKTMLDTHEFILTVRADVPPEELSQELPQILKISALEGVLDLITHALPGIPIKILPAAPRKIPFYAGYTYFSLDNHHTLWSDLKTSTGLAFHIPTHFPGFHFEVWTVQRNESSSNARG